MERYRGVFDGLIANGLVTEEQARNSETYLSSTDNYDDLAEVDFVFECVAEVLEAKYEVYANLEAHCPQFQAIASTTSAMSATLLADGLRNKKNQAKLVVAHPWNPPHLVPCIEVVRSTYTSDETVEVVKDFLGNGLGRAVSLMNRDAPGSIGNRLQHALLREAINIVEEGIATPEDVDRTLMYSFMPRYTSIGLFEHQDNAGLDLVDSIDKYLFPDLSTAQTTQKFITDRVARGDLGIKTGKGVYDWSTKDLDGFYQRASKPYFQFFNWKLPEPMDKAQQDD